MAVDLYYPLPKSAALLFGDPVADSHPPWLKPLNFSRPDFDPEQYISDLRTFVPVETLRSELQTQLCAIKLELVELINNDHPEFFSLCTKLVDVDAAVVRMRAPLLDIKEKILAFRASIVDGSLTPLQSRLNHKSQANGAGEILELLLDSFHVVSKVEKLIKEVPLNSIFCKNDQVRECCYYFQHSETQSMVLGRIASEISRLKFCIAQTQNLPFIDNIEKRIQNDCLLLDSSLESCFVNGLEGRDVNAICNCLRAYADVGSTNSAENICRSIVVSPFIQKAIFDSGSYGDDLEQYYERIKQHVKDECAFLLEISSSESSGLHIFNFLANSILKEVMSAIMKRKPGAFSPGRPTEFLRNYKSSLDFLGFLEGHCPSRTAVAKFRADEMYTKFMKQWNIGAYFSLRFQEIAGALDFSLMNTTLIPSQNTEDSQSLSLKQSISLLGCLKACWRDDVIVLPCLDKFLRLFFQLISRYSNWLSAVLDAPRTGALSASPDHLLDLIHDLTFIVKDISGDYLVNFLERLKESCSSEVVDLVERSILEGGNTIKSLQPLVIASIVETLVERSVDNLEQQLKVTYMMMTNKTRPVRYSMYVSGLLHHLKIFLEGEQATKYLTSELRKELLKGTISEITCRYYNFAAKHISMADEKVHGNMRVGASSEVVENNLSNIDKIRMQVFLDIQEYGRNVTSLGVDAADIPTYRSLWQCVAPQERRQSISF